jgi:glycosyltransferase involved in cell wall biosynthesis
MNQYKLSIVIPTFNRTIYLQETLNSLIKCINRKSKDLVEIVINDNASTDDTNHVALSYVRQYNFVKYYRNEINLGFDTNVLLGLHHAQGEFVWFLGDDDKIKDSGLSYVIDVINKEKNLSVLCINSSLYDRELKEIKIIKKIKINEDRIYNNHNDVLFHMNFALCYLSTLIMKKEYCSDVNDASSFLGTGFIHFYLVLNVLLKGNCYYVSEPYVIQRGDNAPEFDKVQVFMYGLNTIIRRARKLGYNTKSINKLLDSNIMGTSKRTLAELAEGKSERNLLPVFISAYWSRPLFWVIFFPMYLLPSILLRIVYRVGKMIKNNIKLRK